MFRSTVLASTIVGLISVSVALALPTFIEKYDCNAIREQARVKNVDWSRYLGQWYELYRSKGFYFDHGCSCTGANYQLNNDGTIRVDNSCIRDKKLVSKIGSAKIAGNASLEVRFGIFGSANYDVVYISDDYEYAGVLSCSNVPFFGGLNLWILSRNKDGAYVPERISDVFTHFYNIGLRLYTDTLIQTNQTHCATSTPRQNNMLTPVDTDIDHFHIPNLFREYFIVGTSNRDVSNPRCAKLSFIRYPPNVKGQYTAFIHMESDLFKRHSQMYEVSEITPAHSSKGILKFYNSTINDAIFQVINSVENEVYLYATLNHEHFNHTYFLSAINTIPMDVISDFVDVAHKNKLTLGNFTTIMNEYC